MHCKDIEVLVTYVRNEVKNLSENDFESICRASLALNGMNDGIYYVGSFNYHETPDEDTVIGYKVGKFLLKDPKQIQRDDNRSIEVNLPT